MEHSEESIPFVHIIICPEYFNAYNKKALEYYGIEKENYKRNGYFYPKRNGASRDPRHIFTEVSHAVEDILNGIQIKTLSKENPYIDIDFNDENAWILFRNE